VIELRAAGLVVIASQVLGVASSAPCPGMLDINAAESATPVAMEILRLHSEAERLRTMPRRHRIESGDADPHAVVLGEPARAPRARTSRT